MLTEELVQALQSAGFPDGAANDLALQGHQRTYEPGSLVWKKHVPVEWLILPLGDGLMTTGAHLWNTPLAIRAAAAPEMLQSDLVCGDRKVETLLIPRSMLILAARYYPEILLGCLQPFSLPNQR